MGILLFKRRVISSIAVIIVYLSPYSMGVIPQSKSIPYFILGTVIVAYHLLSGSHNKSIRYFIFLILTSCVMLAALDLAIRPFAKNMLNCRPDGMFSHDDYSVPDLAIYDRNIVYNGIAYGELASMQGDKEYRVYKEMEYITDEYGYRNLPGAAKKENDIILLGDSFAAGFAVTQKYTFSSIFSNNYNLVTYNLAQTGTPWHHLVRLRLMWDKINKHDKTAILFFVFDGNDLGLDLGSGYKSTAKNIIPDRGLKCLFRAYLTFRRQSPIKKMLYRSYCRWFTSKRLENVMVRDFLDGRKILYYIDYINNLKLTEKDIKKHVNYNYFKNTFKELKEFSEEKGVPVYIILIPTKAQVYAWPIKGNMAWEVDRSPSGFSICLRNICSSSELPFLDLKPHLIDEAKRAYDENGEFLWYMDDTHFNPLGNEATCSLVYREFFSNSDKNKAADK